MWTLHSNASLPRATRPVLAILIALLLSSCATRIMPAPNLYTTAEQQLFQDLSPELENSRLETLYVTDRSRDDGGAATPRYGFGRSASVAFGSVTFELEGGMSWQDLVTYSTSRSSRFSRPRVRIDSIEEFGRLPATP